jgi:hypothetical protein
MVKENQQYNTQDQVSQGHDQSPHLEHPPVPAQQQGDQGPNQGQEDHDRQQRKTMRICH